MLLIFNGTLYSRSYHKKYLLTKRGTYVEKNGFVFYTIKRGDTLFKIAKRFNVTSIDEIRRTNKINNDRTLMPGAVLKIEKKDCLLKLELVMELMAAIAFILKNLWTGMA